MAALFSTTLLSTLFLLPFQPSSAQTLPRNISLGSTISTVNSNRAWFSSSGDFAFGFYPLPGSNLSLVAIWFDKLPNKTVVWTARLGDDEKNPIQAPLGSTARLAENGRLLVQNQHGEEIWSAKPSDPDVAYASMLDTGNFVLAGSVDPINKWQSFDHPTDTLLPSQVLNKGSYLSARLKEDNFTNGRFQLVMKDEGNLVLLTVAFPTGNIYKDYWSVDTDGTGSQLAFNTSGLLYIKVEANNLSNESFRLAQDTPIGSEYYHRVTLDFDGILRKYVYRKNGSDGGLGQAWSAVWSVPDNICTAINADNMGGGGACGFNSYCTLDTRKQPTCECPPGYSFVDPFNKFMGCKQDIVLQQECGGDESNAAHFFQLNDMQGVDWPFADYEKLTSMNEDSCGRACLVDCLCAVAIYGDGNCWKKRLPMSNGRKDSSVTRKVFIKLAKANSSSPSETGTPRPPSSSSRHKNKDALIVVFSVLFGSSAFVNIICLAALALILLSNRKVFLCKHKNRVPSTSSFPSSLLSFSYEEIVEATNDFRDEIGRGGFGSVFKGSLPGQSNASLAVKRLDRMTQRGQKEFQTELMTINKVHHKNLVPLLGFCDEGPHRMLVYQFMSNGSLAKILFSTSERPSWDTRLQIAFGIARGLLYLHEECGTQIIHCDIKPENVLLDDHLTAKISDFGLAKLLTIDQSKTTTAIRGTKGYVAPEWFKSTAITAKVDVYSYGVMVLEIICCRKNVEMEIEGEQNVILTEWAHDCYREGALNLLVKDDAEAFTDLKILDRLMKVAIWCIQEDPSRRPSMKKVSQMLEGTVEVPIPPNPSPVVSGMG